jgi:hypothetical protein
MWRAEPKGNLFPRLAELPCADAITEEVAVISIGAPGNYPVDDL